MNPVLLTIFIIIGGLFAILWLYVAARVVTRGIVRTLREKEQ